MIPTAVILDAIANLLANDTATIAPAALACHVHLIAAPFTPGAGLTFGSLTPATFTGSTPANAGVGPQQEFTDPTSTLRVVQLEEPAGGWHWLCTAGTGLPQTIYGYAVTDNADTVLLGSALLPAPVVINGSGQAIDVPYIRFTFVNNSPF
jgi:hypothetical protein